MRLSGGRPDAFQQMGLAHAGRPVEHQRRQLARLADDHLGRSDGQPVGFAGHKRLEAGEAAARRRAAGSASAAWHGRPWPCESAGTAEGGCALSRQLLQCGLALGLLHGISVAFVRRAAFTRRGVEMKLQGRALAQHLAARLLDMTSEVRPNPLQEELVRRGDPQRTTIVVQPHCRAEPQIESFLPDLVGQTRAHGRHDLPIVLGHFRCVLGTTSPDLSHAKS